MNLELNLRSEAAAASRILDNFVNIMSLLFICRTVLSWYPKTDLTKFPYSVAVWPTEPLLVPVRELIPPAFGVDISAIVWVGVLSFMREVLTGTQGILALVEKGM
jgi:YggT family protein